MAQDVTIQMDISELGPWIKEVAKGSSRTMVQVINGQARNLAFRAIEETKKADSQKMSLEFGQTHSRIARSIKSRGGEYKRIKPQKKYSSRGTLLQKVINRRRIDKGKKPIWGRRLEAMERKLRSARLKSVGFIKSGWLDAIDDLSVAVGAKRRFNTDREVKKFKSPRNGYAIPASESHGLKPFCIIANAHIIPTGKHSSRPGNPRKYAEEGLAKAMPKAILDIKRHMAERMAKFAKEMSVK